MELHILTYNVRGLPWCKCPINDIATWAAQTQAPILCFQEVFTHQHRQHLKQVLERYQYTVLIPHDDDVCLLSSGLLTAVHSKHFKVRSTCFISYLTYYNVESFANKGFQTVRLESLSTGGNGGGSGSGSGSSGSGSGTGGNGNVYIVNTHTQSDEEVGWISTKAFRKGIRNKQAQQIIDHFEGVRDPVLVVGDFNQESSLHPFLRTLHPPSSLPLKKATFFRTGEDLDHVAWMPIQWSAAIGGCGFCGEYGPALTFCKVHPVAFSDHAPVELRVRMHSR